MTTREVTVFSRKYCISHLGGMWKIYGLLPAFIISSGTIVVVSLIE